MITSNIIFITNILDMREMLLRILCVFENKALSWEDIKTERSDFTSSSEYNNNRALLASDILDVPDSILMEDSQAYSEDTTSLETSFHVEITW